MIARTQLAARALSVSGLAPLVGRIGSRPVVLALAYHRIGDGADSIFDRGLWSATAEGFDQQVRLLKRDWDVIGPQDLPTAARSRRGRYVLITFDDGYRDNYEVAFPILKSHGATATFLISTGFIDRPAVPWWDQIAWMVRRSARREPIPASRWVPEPLGLDEPTRQRAVEKLLATYKALPGHETGAFLAFVAEATGSGACPAEHGRDLWMTWDMLRQMRREGMSLGGHTVSHPILARLPAAQQRQEIAGCRQRLEAELGEPMRWFSYPRGKADSFNQVTRQCLKQEQVGLAFSYYGGVSRLDAGHWDPYDVRRTAIELEVDRHRFAAILALPRLFA